MARILIIAITLFINFNHNKLFSQEHSEAQNSTKNTHLDHKNDLGGFFGATYIFKSGFVLPTVGIEYVRKLNSHFGVGLITEFEIGSHIISENEETEIVMEIERSSAVLLLPAIYYVIGQFAFSAGYGVEFEKSENLGLFKITANYVLELKNEAWIVVPNVSWDHTSIFDGLVYGFSVARRF